ncbi:MAG: TiaS agmantine-binding domain-containing protein [Candidatus Hodarchaeales archaeon]|jgi:tRNA(Ile2)-agmatinylcytidine synthase
MLREVHFGLDDTDSHSGMCTTYLGTIITDFLESNSVQFLDFPKLVRLNPNIPYKTRGNGAVSISLITKDEKIDYLWKNLKKLVKKYSDLEAPNTDPGFVMNIGKPDERLGGIYNKALYSLVSIDKTKQLLSTNYSGEFYCIKEGRGLIGASAAIGANLFDDYTYELIAYRNPENTNSERLIDVESVIRADKHVPLSFNNYDYENKELMITPHGPDPVYVGIRGETPQSVIQMWKLIKKQEEIANIMVFKSNQHTRPHFPKKYELGELKPYHSVRTEGIVEKEPYDIQGGHVLFSISSKGEKVNCAAYEPTKKFRNLVRQINKGDLLQVCGGVRPASQKYPMTINLEEFKIQEFKKDLERITLNCPECNSKLTSLGKNQGLKCKKCSFKTSEKDICFQSKIRKLKAGVSYIIPICAQRHLTKPLVRETNLNNLNPSDENYGFSFQKFLANRRKYILSARTGEKRKENSPFVDVQFNRKWKE